MRSWALALSLVLGMGVLSLNSSRAQTPAIEELSKEMAFQMEMQTHLIKMAHEGTGLMERGELVQVQDWENYLRRSTEEYLEVMAAKSGVTTPPKFWKVWLDKIKWRNLATTLKNTLWKSRKIIRLNGAAFLATDMIGTVAKWTAVAGLSALNARGLSEVPATVIFVISQLPTTVVATAMSGQIEKQLRRRDKVKLWGGDAELKEIEAARAAARRELGLAEVRDVLLPLTREGSPDLLVRISTLGNFGKLTSRLGLKADKLSYSTLKRELKAAGFESEMMAALDQPNKFSPAQRAAFLLSDLKHAGRDDIIDKLVEKFPSHFQVQAKKFATHPEEVPEWIKLMRAARNPDEVLSGMQKVPKGLRAQEVVGIWREQLIPLYTEQLDSVDYFSMRDLIARNATLELAAETAPESLWDEAWDQRFAEYWNAGLTHPRNPILRTCTEIFRRLHL